MTAGFATIRSVLEGLGLYSAHVADELKKVNAKERNAAGRTLPCSVGTIACALALDLLLVTSAGPSSLPHPPHPTIPFWTLTGLGVLGGRASALRRDGRAALHPQRRISYAFHRPAACRLRKEEL